MEQPSGRRSCAVATHRLQRLVDGRDEDPSYDAPGLPLRIGGRHGSPGPASGRWVALYWA